MFRNLTVMIGVLALAAVGPATAKTNRIGPPHAANKAESYLDIMKPIPNARPLVIPAKRLSVPTRLAPQVPSKVEFNFSPR